MYITKRQSFVCVNHPQPPAAGAPKTPTQPDQKKLVKGNVVFFILKYFNEFFLFVIYFFISFFGFTDYTFFCRCCWRSFVGVVCVFVYNNNSVSIIIIFSMNIISFGISLNITITIILENKSNRITKRSTWKPPYIFLIQVLKRPTLKKPTLLFLAMGHSGCFGRNIG